MGYFKVGYYYNILGNSNYVKFNNKRFRKINN